MRQLAQSELDGSPNKGPKKQLKVLADALDRTIETGASTANMGHAVKARYKGMFGGKPLDDLDKEQANFWSRDGRVRARALSLSFALALSLSRALSLSCALSLALSHSLSLTLTH